ncbi:MAG: MBL fold metallo-hydrolase [Gammaproteobacteria bacterium]|nr:MBL fold metallo-hydrolase [Gammaproteobacteria bacterium]MBT3718957.1 MBL fold metallo-hydrolase [Gammaproteobacteria bacterium]MBT3845409.1 MBL fold metallo-hydrolase [Gammaproteobacteria bacterium]MBT3892979.1 MBL fold metallo-hydrolase [Gammaproteobacteria bacterium]MBT4301581.1 MBL fold metallo-hydrolase [Gammaproteobacteria bacterium]
MRKIKMIEVAPGISWIEVPEVDLRILCGCPADSVKHLMKRGLIVFTERDGVKYELGPNAILLSDVLLQNGEFSSMAEFPVLQMLYRQGMILPGHPNNNGQKPLLIGSKDQVHAQMEYIYRGNYGLVSKEEMLAAGADEATADEQMAMKLRFAFGAIRPTEDLLDTRVVADGAVEIMDGVSVQRKQQNVFEVSYEGESVVVDLNLSDGKGYEVPYPLDFHNVTRGYFSVLHSGQGDGWDPNRPSMSSILMFQGKVYLIDVGPNVHENLAALGISLNEIHGLFHTHTHDDHFAGLATLARSGHRIEYYATPLVRASVTKKLCALLTVEPEFFEKCFNINDLILDEWNNIDGLEVRPIFSPHPVETTIMRFRSLWEDGYHTYAHFADIAAFSVIDGMLESDELPGLKAETIAKIKNDYLEPANTKKIDIGGGMIHGDIEDFAGDLSEKIILSHSAVPYTDRQKEIGSGAPFGAVDHLIPIYQNYVWRFAVEYLKSYFPTASDYYMRILLNNKVELFNPEAIILKEGAVNSEVFLTLTGNVEMLGAAEGVNCILYAGTIIGENSGLLKLPSPYTYRSTNFVQALRIPSSLFKVFVSQNNLHDEISKLEERRDLLNRMPLFSEAISYALKNKISHTMESMSCAAGETVNIDQDALFIISSGVVEDNFEVQLSVADYFGEERSILSHESTRQYRVVEDAEFYLIPGGLLREIPILLWKVMEGHERRAGK